MAQVQQSQRAVCPYCLLGIKAGSSLPEVERTYQRLITKLAEENFMDSPQEWVQSQQAYMAIENAYQQIIEGDITPGSTEGMEIKAEPIPPKLGQMLVAAGIITLDELEEAIAAQKTVDLPLGEILKRSSLITQMELDAFLLNQNHIRLPPDSPYHIGQRLIGLGLVTEDMVRIAIVEQRTSGKPVGQILVERGWLANDILKALLTY